MVIVAHFGMLRSYSCFLESFKLFSSITSIHADEVLQILWFSIGHFFFSINMFPQNWVPFVTCSTCKLQFWKKNEIVQCLLTDWSNVFGFIFVHCLFHLKPYICENVFMKCIEARRLNLTAKSSCMKTITIMMTFIPRDN